MVNVNFSAAIFKEIQRCVFFACYDNYAGGSQMTSAASEALLEKEFYGDPDVEDSIGMAKKFVLGVGVFADAFVEDFVTVNNITVTRKLLKPSLTPSNATKIHMGNGDNEVNVPLLSRRALSVAPTPGQEDDGLVHGEFIKSQSGNLLRSLKKAVAYGEGYLDSNGNLPSGGTPDDYYDHIQGKMYTEWVVVNGKKKIARDKNKAKARGLSEPPLTESVILATPVKTNRPANWMFEGYMCLVLFGRFGSNELNALKSRKYLLVCRFFRVLPNNPSLLARRGFHTWSESFRQS
jgi:hypothetical protein